MEKSITHPSAAQPCAESPQQRLLRSQIREVDRAMARLEMWRGVLDYALKSGDPMELTKAARLIGEDCCGFQESMWRLAR